MVKIYYSILFLIFFISSCGLNNNQQTSPNAKVLDGGWATDCLNLSGEYLKLEANFSGTSMTFYTEIFADSSCATKNATIISTNTIEVLDGTVSGMREGVGYKFNSTVVNTTVTPASAAYATTLNGSSECGATNWSSGVAKSITGLTCSTFSDYDNPQGLVSYELVSIADSYDPDYLLTADDTTGNSSSEAERPTNVINTFYLIKCSQADCGN